MGKKKTEEYNSAYDLFCNTDMNQKQIAGIVKVSEVQLGKWSRDNDWELDKSAKQVTVEKIIRDLYQQLADMNSNAKKEKRTLNSTETDQIIKITTSIQSLRKKYNLSSYHAVLKDCLEWMMKEDNEKAKLFAPSMLEFLKVKANELKNDI